MYTFKNTVTLLIKDTYKLSVQAQTTRVIRTKHSNIHSNITFDCNNLSLAIYTYIIYIINTLQAIKERKI